MIKPDIVEVAEYYTSVRRRGPNYVAVAVCHNDHRPSMRIDAQKQLWYCDVCAKGGDVISLVQIAENVSFREACEILKLDTHRARPPLTASRRRAAELAANWARQQRAKFNYLLIDALEQRDLADEIGDSGLAEVFEHEIVMLRGFHQGLEHPSSATQMLAARQAVEQITNCVEVVDEPPTPFPPLTPEYLAYLKKLVGPSKDFRR